MSFFEIALTELNDSISDDIKHKSLAHRLSKLETKDFDKLLKEGDSESSKKIVVDHEAQMKQSQRIKNGY